MIFFSYSLSIDKKKMTKIKPKNNYQGGAEEFKGFIRLSSNENNDGPSTRVETAIKKNVNFSNINGRVGLKSGSKGCKLAMKGKGRAYGKNS